MTLTDRQAHALEMEFLQHDLGRAPSEMPVSTAKRELTRALYERSTTDDGVCPRPLIPAAHSAIQDTVAAVIRCLDQVVTAWEGERSVTSKAQPQVADGVRAAATIIAEAAQRAGLTTPDQPVPEASYEASARKADRDQLADRYEVFDETHEFTADDTKRVAEAIRTCPGAGNVIVAGSTADGQPAAEWTPSDGGLTPSMFGGGV